MRASVEHLLPDQEKRKLRYLYTDSSSVFDWQMFQEWEVIEGIFMFRTSSLKFLGRADSDGERKPSLVKYTEMLAIWNRKMTLQL